MPRGHIDSRGVERWLCAAAGCGCTDRPTDASSRLRLVQVTPWVGERQREPRRARRVPAVNPTAESRPQEPVATTGGPQGEHRRHWSARDRAVAALASVAALLLIVAGIVALGESSDHSARTVYAYTVCGDGWISHSQGPGSCSWHDGVARYVYKDVPAPSGGWSSLGR